MFGNQDIHAEKYLFFYGVVRRQDVVSGNRSFYGASTPQPSEVIGNHLATSLSGAGNKNSSGAYQLIYIYGANGAHAMAAWTAQDVSFFDPNFGEFWFASPAKFREWFKDFWTSSGYSRSFNKYELRSFAKKMGHVGARPAVKGSDRL
jgi:YopT peptidase